MWLFVIYSRLKSFFQYSPVMSIALSAEIRPSRIFSFFYVGFAAVFFLTGILISLGKIGHFEVVIRQFLAFSMFLTAFFLIFVYFRSRKTLRIDISGNGQIRLKEYRKGVSKLSSEDVCSSAFTEIWELSANSTVWPTFMILQLKAENGKRTKVLICLDSLNKEHFKALYTSIRWIEAHRKIE